MKQGSSGGRAVKRLAMLVVLLLGCECGVTAGPPHRLPDKTAGRIAIVGVVARDMGCGRVFCNTRVHVIVRSSNPTGRRRGEFFRCRYTVQGVTTERHTDMFSVPSGSYRLVRIVHVVTVEKPQYWVGRVRCRAEGSPGPSRWTDWATFALPLKLRMP